MEQTGGEIAVADTTLGQAKRILGVAAAANYTNRFTAPMHVTCPQCGQTLPPGWSHRWSCTGCGSGGDVVDYLRATGLSFVEARDVVLAKASQWSAWEKDALREAVPMPFVLDQLGVAQHGGRIHCLNSQGHRRGDANPSCAVYPSTVHCYACGYHADVITVWETVRDTDFRSAWSELMMVAQNLDGPVSPCVTPRSSTRTINRNGLDFVPLYDEVLSCCEPLLDTPGALYLADRGIDPHTAERQGVRWVSNQALGRIQHLLQSHPNTIAESSGLLSSDGLFTLRCHRLLIPSQRDGHTVWLQGRSTRADVGKRWRWRSLTGITPWPVGLPLLDSAPADTPVFVTEGSTDWLALLSMGQIAIGVPGAQAIANTWLRLLADRRVVLCHDPDDAGALGAQLWRERLAPYRPVIQRLPLPPRTDVCALLHVQSTHGQTRQLPAPVALPEPAA